MGKNLLAVRQSSGAFDRLASNANAPEDWRTPRRYRAIRSFMVPMQESKATQFLHS